MLQSNQTARSHRSSLQLWSASMLNKHLHFQIFSPTARQTCLRHGDKHQNVANYELISVNPRIPVLCFESLHPGTSRKTVSLIFMVLKMSEFHHFTHHFTHHSFYHHSPITQFTIFYHHSPIIHPIYHSLPPYFTIIHPSTYHLSWNHHGDLPFLFAMRSPPKLCTRGVLGRLGGSGGSTKILRASRCWRSVGTCG